MLMALHPRLGRDSPLRRLEPGVVARIAYLIRAPVAAGAPLLSDFDDFLREEREEEAAWAAEMRAELDAASEEEEEEEAEEEEEGDGEEGDSEAGGALGCLGLPTMASIVQSAAAGTAGTAAAAASVRGEGGPAGGGPAPRLDDEALEALESAGKGYFRDMELLAAAVSPSRPPSRPPPHPGAPPSRRATCAISFRRGPRPAPRERLGKRSDSDQGSDSDTHARLTVRARVHTRLKPCRGLVT